MKVEKEKALEKKLTNEIKKLSGWSIKLPASQLMGLPDRLCLFTGGRVCFAEVKSTGVQPTRRQLIVHNKLRRLGFDVRVVDSTPKIEKIVEDYNEPLL